jgi:hypothetical protein
MPANLNALIRYKAIDRCLSNRFSPCNIGQLQEICSEALGEFRGVYKKVSERTIRDDIRVMRSEMLGFNAPIVCKDGLYSYSDPNYSIFAVSIRDMALLKQVMQILLDNRMRLREKGVDDVIRELGMLIKEESYFKEARQPIQKSMASYSIDFKEKNLPIEKADHKALKQTRKPGRFSILIKRIRLRKQEQEYKDISYLPASTESDSVSFSIMEKRISFVWGEVLNLVG